MEKDTSRLKVAELVAELQYGRWTMAGAAEAVGKDKKWAEPWFAALLKVGCIRSAGSVHREGETPEKLWEWV